MARDTLRKAIQVLDDEGLVETVTGMGIYARPRVTLLDAFAAPGR